MNTNQQKYAALSAEDKLAIDSMFKHPRLQRALNTVYDTVMGPLNRLASYLTTASTKSFIADFEAAEARRNAKK
jgi:hypothetical protein